jgi:hypothetical protein
MKEKLEGTVSRITDMHNKHKPDDEPRYRKNEIIVKALKIGLKILEKRIEKKI